MTPQEIASHRDSFNREGYVLLPGVLSTEEAAVFKNRIDEAFEDPACQSEDRRYGEISMVRMFELDRIFRDMLVREPIIDVVEAILGGNCHVVANNVIRNPPGMAIDNFHVDDVVWFPLPDEIERHDARIIIPGIINVQIPLTDVPTVEHGSTQVVPGSHYSGRQPNDPAAPEFEDQGVHSILCKAGDAYLQHGQVWHRGAPNNSDQTRCLLQQCYAARHVSQRFYPFLNYSMPEDVLDGADERMLRLLGKHSKGAYG